MQFLRRYLANRRRKRAIAALRQAFRLSTSTPDRVVLYLVRSSCLMDANMPDEVKQMLTDAGVQV